MAADVDPARSDRPRADFRPAMASHEHFVPRGIDPNAGGLSRRGVLARGLVALAGAASPALLLWSRDADAKPRAVTGRQAAQAGAAQAKDSGVFETKGENAILVDYESGTVLFEKNPDRQFPPASLAKMMTVAVLFNEIREGRVKLEQDFLVSEHAWRTGGAPSRTSCMFAPVNSRVKIVDLIQGIMIQSANDGAIAVAEGIAGSEDAFAELMNKRAKEIGLKNTSFGNPTGLPHFNNKATARDLYLLARHLIAEFPEFYKYYSQREFTYNNIRQFNRNPLLNDGIGADGLKTGYIKESGYNIVGSANQNGQRLIMVMSGCKSEKERAEEARKLMDWGFRTFEQIKLYDKDEVVGEASVYGGASGRVPLVSEKTVNVLVPRGNRDKLKGRVVYSGPVKAPVEKGRPIGRLLVLRDDQVMQETPLVAAGSVEIGTLRQRAFDAVGELLVGWIKG